MPRDQGRHLLVVVVLLAAAGLMLFASQHGLLGGGRAIRSLLSGSGMASGYELAADIDNWQRTERERTVTTPFNFSLNGELSDVPLQLGDWRGEDVPQTDLEVFILLEPEQYVQRIYRLPDGRFVWLSLIGSRKAKSFHSPQICYDTDGWRTEASSLAVPLGQGEVYALQLAANKDLGGGNSAEHIVLYFYLWPGSARDPQDGMVMVKVTAPLYKSVEETVGLEMDFIRQLFPSVRS
jgi:hypothetical protein